MERCMFSIWQKSIFQLWSRAHTVLLTHFHPPHETFEQATLWAYLSSIPKILTNGWGTSGSWGNMIFLSVCLFWIHSENIDYYVSLAPPRHAMRIAGKYSSRWYLQASWGHLSYHGFCYDGLCVSLRKLKKGGHPPRQTMCSVEAGTVKRTFTVSVLTWHIPKYEQACITCYSPK